VLQCGAARIFGVSFLSIQTFKRRALESLFLFLFWLRRLRKALVDDGSQVNKAYDKSDSKLPLSLELGELIVVSGRWPIRDTGDGECESKLGVTNELNR
jgi:hypothetical protein